MQAEVLLEFGTTLAAVGERGEDAEFDGAEQRLGREETHADLEDLVGCGGKAAMR